MRPRKIRFLAWCLAFLVTPLPTFALTFTYHNTTGLKLKIDNPTLYLHKQTNGQALTPQNSFILEAGKNFSVSYEAYIYAWPPIRSISEIRLTLKVDYLGDNAATYKKTSSDHCIIVISRNYQQDGHYNVTFTAVQDAASQDKASLLSDHVRTLPTVLVNLTRAFSTLHPARTIVYIGGTEVLVLEKASAEAVEEQKNMT